MCAAYGFDRAVVRGCVGSLVGARPGRGGTPTSVDGPATEVISLVGTARPDSADLRCTLVDRHGASHVGRVLPAENPVAVTYEIRLEKVGSDG